MHNVSHSTRADICPSESLRKPKLFQVLLRNDDYTTMAFVIVVLRDFFAKNAADAHTIMLTVHLHGEGVCGVYSRDIAQTKAQQVIQFARENDQPLMCFVRECED